MAGDEPDDTLPALLRGTMAGLVRREQADLSARQMAIFMICYLDQPSQTVRGLATDLNVSRPAITRALDRLAQFDLIRRRPDPADRRSILVQRTAAGNAFLRELRSILNVAANGPKKAQPKPAARRARVSKAAA